MKEKKLYLEWLRALCMFFVILVHTDTRAFWLFTLRQGSPLYPFYLAVTILCKTAVPVFWMISGALLLPKEESLCQLYRKRVGRMCLTLLLFSLIYALWLRSKDLLEEFGIRFFLNILLTSQWATAFWFLYAYIGMLMLLPLLRRLVKNMRREHFWYLFALTLLMWGVRPIAEFLASPGSDLHLNPHLAENIPGLNVLYFVMGYYLGDELDDSEITGRGMLRWLGAALLGMLVMGAAITWKMRLTGDLRENADSFFETLLALPACAIFYAARYRFLRRPVSERAKKLLLTLGSCAFGVMLWEGLLRYELDFIYPALAGRMPGFLACLVWVAAVYLCGLVLTLCLKRIPGIKKLL